MLVARSMVAPVRRRHFFGGAASQVFGALEAVQGDCFPSLHTALSGLAPFYALAWRQMLPGRGVWLAFSPTPGTW